MNAATTKRAPAQRPEEGDWLVLLLADIQREIASQPSPRAVERIRARLLSSIERPTQAAA